MIRISLEQQIEELKSGILKMLEIINTNLGEITSYFSRKDRTEFNPSTALTEIKTNDLTVRSLGNELETQSVRILSLQAPVGRDLRLVISSFRMIYDLQRISRDALNAFQDVMQIDSNKIQIIYTEIEKLVKNIGVGIELLNIFRSIYLQNTVEHQEFPQLMEKSIKLDNKIDDTYDKIVESVFQKENIGIETGVHLLSANRSLERYGDHACNIIERAIYIQTGDRVLIK